MVETSLTMPTAKPRRHPLQETMNTLSNNPREGTRFHLAVGTRGQASVDVR